MSYGEYRPPRGEPVVQLHYGENAPIQRNINTGTNQSAPNWLGKEGGGVEHTSYPRIHAEHLFDVGILKDTLLPNLALHSTLAVGAWGVGRYYNYVESKDLLWSSGQLINAWWSAVGRRLILDGTPLATIFRTLSWPERLLLAGTTLWGGHMTYRIASRAAKRGTDDPRYDAMKKDDGFWNKALVSNFLPEALFQALISLPLTAPFTHQGGVMSGYHPMIQSLAVGVFTAGFAMEVLADHQLQAHKEKSGNGTMLREGVWSIVRHPNYLGDFLVHASFPILLFSSDMLAPIELLGPAANYIFMRYFSGDRMQEASQSERYAKENPAKKAQFDEYRQQKNSFWPDVKELSNEWVWYVVGAGVAGVAVEQVVKAMLH